MIVSKTYTKVHWHRRMVFLSLLVNIFYRLDLQNDLDLDIWPLTWLINVSKTFPRDIKEKYMIWCPWDVQSLQGKRLCMVVVKFWEGVIELDCIIFYWTPQFNKHFFKHEQFPKKCPQLLILVFKIFQGYLFYLSTKLAPCWSWLQQSLFFSMLYPYKENNNKNHIHQFIKFLYFLFMTLLLLVRILPSIIGPTFISGTST